MKSNGYQVTFASDLEAVGFMTVCFGGEVGEEMARFFQKARQEESTSTTEAVDEKEADD